MAWARKSTNYQYRRYRVNAMLIAALQRLGDEEGIAVAKRRLFGQKSNFSLQGLAGRLRGAMLEVLEETDLPR